MLSISDSEHRVPTELGQESQASSCVQEEKRMTEDGITDSSVSKLWELAMDREA